MITEIKGSDLPLEANMMYRCCECAMIARLEYVPAALSGAILMFIFFSSIISFSICSFIIFLGFVCAAVFGIADTNQQRKRRVCGGLRAEAMLRFVSHGEIR